MEYSREIGLIGKIKVWMVGNKPKEEKEHTNKKESFMSKYSTEKSAEELKYEEENIEPKIYYQINEKKYKTPFLFTDWCFREIGKNDGVNIRLKTNDNKTFIIEKEKMRSRDIYHMLKKLTHSSINEIGLDIAMISKEDRKFASICKQAKVTNEQVEILYENNEIELAVNKLEKIVKKILEYNKERLNKENIR